MTKKWDRFPQDNKTEHEEQIRDKARRGVMLPMLTEEVSEKKGRKGETTKK